jgi:uncharacterized protein
VRRFLAAGGLPGALVELPFADGTSVLAPLIHRAVITHLLSHDPTLHHAGLELLLQAGADVDVIRKNTDGRDETPLMAACIMPCCTAPLRLLLAHGANPALKTPAGEAALHTAASAGRLESCNLLLQAGCEVDVRECKGFTPLALAVYKGHVRVVELLHKQWGADLFIRLVDGGTMLHLAAASGQTLVLEYLLRNGLEVNVVTAAAWTPVILAAKNGHTAAVQTLLEHGASTTAVLEGGENALMIAVKQGHTGVAQLLLSTTSSNQTVDVDAENDEGRTALHMAACTDRADLAALLLQHGAAVNACNDQGFTPLLVASAASSAELVQLLLDAGAYIPAQHIGVTALHAAASNDKGPDVLQLLLQQHGAVAILNNLVPQCGCCGQKTALMFCEQPAHLKLLLAAGADVHKTTDTGNTALHVAAVHKFAAPVLCLLIKAGVDLHAENSDGKTAAQVAADTGSSIVDTRSTRQVRLLCSH